MLYQTTSGSGSKVHFVLFLDPQKFGSWNLFDLFLNLEIGKL